MDWCIAHLEWRGRRDGGQERPHIVAAVVSVPGTTTVAVEPMALGSKW